MTRSMRSPAGIRGVPHPDAGRVAGYVVAIALNAALFLLLLRPMDLPPVATPHVDRDPDVTWVKRDEPKPRPIEVPVTPPQSNPVQHPNLQARTAPTPPAPVAVANGSLPPVDPAPAVDPAPVAPPSMAAVSPPPMVSLEYLRAPPPAYPRAAMRMNREGTVLLAVLVGVDGKPLRVDVRDSSGDQRLDDAAREQVLRHWRFRPAMRDGRAVQAIGLVPVEFKLK